LALLLIIQTLNNGKKKTSEVVYTPLSSNIPNVQQIQQIEKYSEFPEGGVKYAKYSRRAVSNGQYALRNQATRFIQFVINDGATGNHIYTRPEASTKIFYCTYMIMQRFRAGGAVPSVIYVSDVNGTAATVRIPYREQTLNVQEDRVFDFSSCPREFSGNGISIYTQLAFTAPNEVAITLFGFEEDK